MGLMSSFFERPLIGLDIGVSGIKAVELSGRKSPRLVAYNRIPLPWDAMGNDGEIKDRPLIVSSLRRLLDAKGFTTKRVAVGVAGTAIIAKKISMPRMSERDVEHQLHWEAEQYLPFNISEVNLDFAILGNSTQSSASGTPLMDVLIVGAKKDYIRNLTSLVEEAGLDCTVVDNQAFAMGNAFEFNYAHLVDTSPGGATSILVDFGAGSTKLSAVEGDKTTFSKELRHGGRNCSLFLSDRLGVSVEEAEKLKMSEADSTPVKTLLAEYVNLVVEEISRALDFFLTQSREKAIQGIYVCGGASKTEGLIEAMETKMPAPVFALNPIQNIAGSGRAMSAQMIREVSYLGSVSIGLALRVAGDKE